MMAIHEPYLSAGARMEPIPDPKAEASVIESFLDKQKASLNIGFDWEAKTYFVKSHPEIALIPIVGETSKFGSWSSTGTQWLSHLLSGAAKSEKYKAALFYIDSPGGAVDGIQEWSTEIRSLGMPTLSFIDGTGASAGLFQAVSADEVYANSLNQNVIGSIGTQYMHVDRREAAKTQIGEVTIYRARQSTLKNKLSSWEEMTKEKEEWLVDRLTESADVFISFVQERRPEIDAKSDAFKGEVFSGPEAEKEGLIDGLLTYQEAIELLESRIPRGTNQSKTNNSKQTMKFKQTWASILGAIGFGAVASEEEAPLVTEERLEQLNGSLETANQKITDLTSEVTQLKADLKSEKDSLQAVEKERDEQKALAEKYAKQAGASHQTPNPGDPEGGNDDLSEEEKAIAALPHNAELDGNPLFN